MKKCNLLVILILLALSGLGLVTACGTNNNSSSIEGSGVPVDKGKNAELNSQLELLYEKAKEEGEVTVWSPTDAFQELVDKFSTRFPGIHVNHFELQGTEAVQRLVMEGQAGKTSTDAFQVSIKDAQVMIDRNLIAKFDNWIEIFGDMGVTEENVLLDGYAIIFYHLSTPLMVNTKLVTPDNMPKSWEDLLDPKWRGQILLEQRAREWGYLATKWSDDQLRQFGQKLKLQEPHFIRGGTTVTQQLAAGDAALATGGYGYNILRLQEKGASVDIAPVGPIGVGTRGFAIMKDAQHPASAQLFTGWASTDEGQQALANATGQGSLGRNSKLKMAKVYRDKGIELLYEDEGNIDRVNSGIKIMQEALGIQ